MIHVDLKTKLVTAAKARGEAGDVFVADLLKEAAEHVVKRTGLQHLVGLAVKQGISVPQIADEIGWSYHELMDLLAETLPSGAAD